MALVLLTLFSLWLFWPSFGLAFGGDEFLALLDLQRAFAASSSTWFSWKFFFTNYGPTDTIFLAIYKLFGTPAATFVASWLLRNLAAITCGWTIYRLSHNRLGAVVGGLFMLVTFAGIETTSWVFNLSSYLSLALFFLFTAAWIELKLQPALQRLILAGGLFWLTIVFQPIRMGGLVITVLVAELLWWLRSLPKINWTYTSLSLLTWTGLFASFFIIGNSFGIGQNWQERVSTAWSNQAVDEAGGLRGRLAAKEFHILTHPLMLLGVSIIPDTALTLPPDTLATPNPRLWVSSFILIWAVVIFILGRTVAPWQGRAWTKIVIVTSGLWLLFVIWFGQLPILDTYAKLNWLATGGVVIITLLWLTFSLKSNLKIQAGMMWALLWMLFSIAFFWLRFPDQIHPTPHRYLITPAAGVSLALGLLVSVGKTRRAQWGLAALVGVLLLLHLLATSRYLTHLRQVRGLTVTENIRTSLPKLAHLGPLNQLPHPQVFYFEVSPPLPDQFRQDVLYHSLMFGFPALVAVREDLGYYPTLVYITSWSELVAIYKNGQGLGRFSWPEKAVPLPNIYSYQLNSQLQLIDQTPSIRQRLEEL